jgi:hypothetical protein
MIQLILNGNPIDSRYVKSVVVERIEKKGADSCRFEVLRNVNVNVGDDLRVRELVNNTFIFGGKVSEVSWGHAISTCTAYSYGKVFDETRIFPAVVYTNTTPEAIVADLRTRYFPDFSVSSASSGVTIDRYEASGSVSENLKILADLAGFDFWTEVDPVVGKVLYFRPANINLGKTLYFGRVGLNAPNALRESYEVDDSQLFNSVEIYGRSQYETMEYRWDALYTPPPIKFARFLSGVGVRYRGTLLKEGVDYRYRPESKMVEFLYPIFASPSDPTVLEVTGIAEATPLVFVENPSSIATYGRRTAIVLVDKILSSTSLSTFASKFLQLHSSPRLTLKVKKPGLDFGFRNGGFVAVYDPLLGISGSNFVVRVVRWKYPEGITELVLSHFEPELYDFQRGVMFRVESSTKSYISSRDFGILEKKFYLKGDNILDETLQTFAYRHRHRPEITTSTAWVRLRLQIVGDTVVEYNTPTTAAAYLSDPANSNRIIPFFLSPLEVASVSSSAGQITIRAQFYISSSYGSTTQYLIAPDPTRSNLFFSTTVNAKQLLNTTIGGVVYFQLDQTFSPPVWRMHWGAGYAPALLFGFGFKI